MAEQRTFIRITHLNTGGHKRAATTHPRVEAVTETRTGPGDGWEEVWVVNISESIRVTRVETTAGAAAMLWLGVIAFDVNNETEGTD